jgi:hypothetical protein
MFTRHLGMSIIIIVFIIITNYYTIFIYFVVIVSELSYYFQASGFWKICPSQQRKLMSEWKLNIHTFYHFHSWGKWSELNILHMFLIITRKQTRCQHEIELCDLNFVRKTASCPITIMWVHNKSRDSSVGVALGCGLDGRCSRVRFPSGAGSFFLRHRVRSGSGANPASYPVGTGGSFSVGKAAGACSLPLTSI